MTCWRCAYGVVSPTQARASGMMPPPVAPASARQTINAASESEKNAPTLPAAQAIVAKAAVRYLPKRSPTGPQKICSDPYAIEKTVIA